MVGINVLITENVENYSSKFHKAQDKMLHSRSYSSKILYSDINTLIGSTAYEKYPITIFENDPYLIILEGMVYNLNDIEKRLIDLAFFSMKPTHNEINQFLLDTDGEFIVLMYNKQEKGLCIFNDRLGRLPLYYHKSNDSVIISRELKFIYPFLESIEFDKTSLMEYLLYEFPLGERTLIRNVNRLLPATAIQLNTKNNHISKNNIVPLNFDAEVIEESVATLKKLFLIGLENRVRKTGAKEPLISLSGGLDSRATLGGLVSLNIKPEGITYDLKHENSGEIEYVQKIAEEFGIPLRFLEQSKKTGLADYSRLVFEKDGSVPTYMAFLLDLYDQIAQIYGNNAILFTGVYGGELFRYLNVTSGLHSDDDLVDFLLNTLDKYLYAPEKVCTMLQVDKAAIRRHLKDHVSAYDEVDVFKKYIHFKFEKDYKYRCEIEDLDRLFFWTTTPFYSQPFFDYAYKIEEHKKDTLFFRNFLYELDARTCNVRYYNTGHSLNDVWKLRLYGLTEKAVRHPSIRQLTWRIINLRRRLKKIRPVNNDPRIEEIRGLLLNLLSNSAEIQKYFSFTESKEIIKMEEEIDKLHRILTLFLYIDLISKTSQGYADPIEDFKLATK